MGNGFRIGNDILTNMVIFGEDLFRLDVIGPYLGGHAPGNINLPRIPRARLGGYLSLMGNGDL